MRMPMSWRLCEISKAPSGKPSIVLHEPLKSWFEARGLCAHVSVSDESRLRDELCRRRAKPTMTAHHLAHSPLIIDNCRTRAICG